jgi:hypothetical protein
MGEKNSNSYICMNKDYKPPTGPGICSHPHVCLEVNTHTGTLDFSFNLLFVVIFSFKIIYKNKQLFLILGFQWIINSCELKKIIVFRDFEVENDVLGLERDMHLSIVKFLEVNIFCFFNFLFVFFVVHRH